jgi:hypothetical protein
MFNFSTWISGLSCVCDAGEMLLSRYCRVIWVSIGLLALPMVGNSDSTTDQ